MRRYTMELLGTFLFVFTVGCTALQGNVSLAPLASGAVLMAMVYAGGHISGAHYNPAVSLAVLLRGRLAPSDLVGYCTAQVVGAVLAAAAAWYVIDPVATPRLSFSGRELGVALIAELIVTFAIAFVVLNVATSKNHPANSFYGLAIGFTWTAGAITVGSITGAAFNPALAIGGSVMGMYAWGSIWIYLVSGLLGGAAAAFAFRYLNPTDTPFFAISRR